MSATAEGNILEDKGGNELCFPRVGIVTDVAQTLPYIEHVPCDVHAADGLDNDAILHKKSFDAVGEVARHGVAVAPVEVGDKDRKPLSQPLPCRERSI